MAPLAAEIGNPQTTIMKMADVAMVADTGEALNALLKELKRE